MSVRAFAAHLGVTVATVSNWDRRRELAVLRTDTQQMLDVDLQRAPVDVQQRFATILADEVDEVRRRGLLAAGVAAMVAPLVSERVMAGGGRPSAILEESSSLTSLQRAILSPASDIASEPLKSEDLIAGASQAWQLRQQSRYSELVTLLADLIPRAEASVAVRDSDDSPSIGTSLVHVYNAASSLFKRLGDESLAAISADRAVRLARRLGATELVAAATFRLSNVLLAAGRPAEAESTALAAADLVDPGRVATRQGLATWGGLVLTAAVSAAQQSDASRAWELLGEARAAGQLLGSEHADMYAIFGPTNVAIHSVQVAAELGDGRDAVRRGREVRTDALPPSLIERRGQFLIDMAYAHSLNHDATAAVDALMEAYAAAPQETRLNGRAHGIVRGLLDHRAGGRQRELRLFADRLGIDGKGK